MRADTGSNQRALESAREPRSFTIPERSYSAEGWSARLSPDGTLFYFTSDREGALQIYEADAKRLPW
jgi:Tol biopolymer transport system component